MRLLSRMAGALAAVALLSGCTAQAEPEEPSDTQDDAAQTEEPSSAEEDQAGDDSEDADDPWAVPDEITVDYAQRVIDELMRIRGEAYRIAADTPREEFSGYAPGDSMAHLDALTNDEDYFVDESTALFDAIENDFGQMHMPPRNRDLTIESVEADGAICMVANGELDATATTKDPIRSRVEMSFHLEQSDDIDEGINPTGWVIVTSTVVAQDYEPFDATEVCS